MWKQHALNIKKHMRHEPIENFLNWSTIQATMFVGNGADYIKDEYDELMGAGWENIIAETRVGNPEIYNGHTSGNLIRQAYHIKQWQDHTGKQVKNLKCIMEVGAGYGALRLIIDRLGFSGKYVIVDIPEVIELQKYYFQRCQLQAEFNVDCSPDLLIGLFSLSEMAVDERKKILGSCAPMHHLIAFQAVFYGIDNMKYFNFGEIVEARPKGCFYLVR